MRRLEFSHNQVRVISPGAFNKCQALEEINFSNNQLIEIPDGLFDSCPRLKQISFDNNQLFELPDALFDKCTRLLGINFNDNQLSKISDSLFDNCKEMKYVFFSNNQLSKIPESLFKNCADLEEIDFSDNRIKKFHDKLLSCCTKLRSLNFEKNNIKAVSFLSLEPLSSCSDIHLTDNFFYNSKSLFSLMFQNCFYKDFKKSVLCPYFDEYRNEDLEHDSKYYIVRNLDYNEVEKYFIAFYLSSYSKTSNSIGSLRSNFDHYKSKKKISILSEFSLLDLLISIFGEIDDSKIINLKKHIDQLILKDENLVNIEFLIRSEKSIENLCRRNIPCHFETFFPNTFYDLISQVRKTNIESADFTSDEKLAFESFCKYVAIKKEQNENIFHQIYYTECFNIALENKNPEIATYGACALTQYFDLKRRTLAQAVTVTLYSFIVII